MKTNVSNTKKCTGGIKATALCGMFAALAAAISFAENLSGINALLPVPGVKLGLANIAVTGAVLCVGGTGAAAVVLIRCLATFLCFGNAVSFVISLSGGILSVIVSTLLARSRIFNGGNGMCSLIGISAASAFSHALGQLIAASVTVGSTAVFSAFPVICSLSVLTGTVTGAAANAVYVALCGTKLAKSYISLD